MSAKPANQIVWDEVSTVKLIKAYEQQNVLWNSEHRGHQNRCTRNEAWVKIADIMQFNLRDVKRKMNSLIAVFRSQHRKGVTNPRWWSGHMSFLLNIGTTDNSMTQLAQTENISQTYIYSESSICSISDDMDGSEYEFLDTDAKKRPYQSAFQEFRAVFEAETPQKRAANDVQPPVVSSSSLHITSKSGNGDSTTNNIVSSNINNNNNKNNSSNKLQLNNVDELSDAETDDTENARNDDDNGTDRKIFIKFLACKMKKYSPSTLSLIQYHFTRVLYEADMGTLEKPIETTSK